MLTAVDESNKDTQISVPYKHLSSFSFGSDHDRKYTVEATHGLVAISQISYKRHARSNPLERKLQLQFD
jgi:hypothetical protein